MTKTITATNLLREWVCYTEGLLDDRQVADLLKRSKGWIRRHK